MRLNCINFTPLFVFLVVVVVVFLSFFSSLPRCVIESMETTAP